MSTIVRSKLGPGAAPDFAVARPDLARRLDECWERRLTVLAAPAGYGKSVLLSQWHAAAADRIAWLTVDERDRDPVRLGAHLLHALAAVEPGLGQRAAGVLGAPGSGLGDEVVDLLLEDLAGLTEPLAVVLEDLDHIDATAVVADLSRLVLEAPPWVHFVVAARSDPAMPTHRLRAGGQLLELRAEDLKFSRSESADLVAALSGLQIADDLARRLVEITEGWPVAVQLAGVSLRGAADAGALARFGATDRGIVDYLSAEVLSWLRPEVREFLLDVSVLDELHPELCDAVTGRSDGARLLDELRQGALFVVPLGGGADGYRLHRLVRELLRHDLATVRPDRPAALRRGAADWCLDRGDVAQAAEYLVAAQAWDRLADLIYENGRDLWEQGQVETVLPWMQAIPAPVRRNQVRLRLMEAALQLLAGRPEAAAVGLAALERDGGLTTGEQAVTDLLFVGLVEVAAPTAESLERGVRSLAALEHLSDDEVPDVLHATDPASARCMLNFAMAKARMYLGVGGALESAVAATSTPPSTPAVYQVHATGMVALLAALAHRPSAVVGARRSLELAAEHLGELTPATMVAQAALAVAARDRGDLEATTDLLEPLLAHAVRWRRWPLFWFLVVERALVDLARGAPRDAQRQLARGSELSSVPPPAAVADRVLAVEVLARGELGARHERSAPTGPPRAWELSFAEVVAAIEVGELELAEEHLASWPTQLEPVGELERELAVALVDRGRGARAGARARVLRLLDATAEQGLVGPFVIAGRAAVALLDDATGERPSRHGDVVLAAVRRAAGRGAVLADPLSDRELEVLQLLPSRMSNAEIGRALFVSTNTVKTHLKHVYLKLDAPGRDDAVRRARELGLL